MDRLELRTHHQARLLRHDLQDRFARTHHLAHRGDLHPQHLARHRRPHVHRAQTPAYLRQPLGDLVLAGLHLPRLFLRLLDPGRAELQDLDLDLRDPPPARPAIRAAMSPAWPSSRAASRSSSSKL